MRSQNPRYPFLDAPVLHLAVESLFRLVAIGACAVFLYVDSNPQFYELLVAFLLFVLLLVVGQEIGAHRIFSHDALNPPKPVRWTLYGLMAMGNFGSALDWRILHLMHHAHSDQDSDPTSPQRFGFWGLVSNYWKWHFLFDRSDLKNQVVAGIMRETARKGFLREWVLARRLTPWMTAGYVFGLYLAFGWRGVATGFALPSLGVSLILNLISYFGHHKLWTSRYAARNSGWLAVISFGGGFHATHHENPRQILFHPKWDLAGRLARALFGESKSV